MTKRKIERNNSGFTLVEVLASVVIISIIFIGVFQLFTFSAKTATSNQSKLVTSHLAKATIERIKVDHHSFFTQETVNATPVKYDMDLCQTIESIDCNLYQFLVNDVQYAVEVTVSQNENKQVDVNGSPLNINEKNLDLINVV